jgi:hypothetical protein
MVLVALNADNLFAFPSKATDHGERVVGRTTLRKKEFTQRREGAKKNEKRA